MAPRDVAEQPRERDVVGHDTHVGAGQGRDAQVDVRGSLGSAVNCPSLATTISNKCVFGACVGHKAELTEICERGLDEIVDRVHDEFTAYRLDLLALESGTATLAADGNSMTGTWTAQINAGQGLRNVPATFTAARRVPSRWRD